MSDHDDGDGGDGGDGDLPVEGGHGDRSDPGGPDDGTVRCWLVDRDYDDQGMVTIVYATPDGRRQRRLQWAAASLARRSVTAAVDADRAALSPVPDDRRERYREEARRMADRHDPDEEV